MNGCVFTFHLVKIRLDFVGRSSSGDETHTLFEQVIFVEQDLYVLQQDLFQLVSTTTDLVLVNSHFILMDGTSFRDMNRGSCACLAAHVY